MNTAIDSHPQTVRRSRGPRFILAAILAAVALGGCARFDVVETNGIKMINVRKPVRSADGTYYTVKLANGETQIIPGSRLLYVVPHGDSNMVFRN